MRLEQRAAPIDQPLPLSQRERQRIRENLGQLRKRMVNQHALHLRSDRARLLVDWHDAAGVQCVLLVATAVLTVLGLRQNLVLRLLHVQPLRRELQLAKQRHALVRLEYVVQEWLVEPDGTERTRSVAYQELENLEARPPRRADAAADDLRRH